MRITNYYLPLSEFSSEEDFSISQKLLSRGGYIKQNLSGIYTFLPIGLRVLKKIENIIEKNLNKYNCIRLSMPTMQDEALWKITERTYGQETLKARDRNGRTLIYSPTNEEVIVDLFRQNIKSYKNLPLNLYQINWKFRDEIRPRYGLMRCREFLMMDSYSFHVDKKDAEREYYELYQCYLSIFKDIGVKTIPMLADTGEIGGDLSHEFHVLAKYGETKVFYKSELEDLDFEKLNFNEILKIEAFTEEKIKKEHIDSYQMKKGIEVGQIFYLGDKYTKKMNAQIQDKEGKLIYPEMCTFGIGVGRLMAAIVEAYHDENGIIWPESISPFDYILINLDIKNEKMTEFCEKKYEELKSKGFSVLYDDSSKSVGEKLNIADLIGISKQIIVGKKLFSENKFEIKNRKTKEVEIFNI